MSLLSIDSFFPKKNYERNVIKFVFFRHEITTGGTEIL